MVHPSSSLNSHSLRGLCAPSGACARPHQPAPREIRTWRDPRSAISTPSAGQIASELAPHRSQGHSCTAARLPLVFGKSSVGCDPPRCRGPKPARARRRWTEEDRPRVTLRRRRRDRCAPTRPSPRATARKRAARLSTRRGHASNSSSVSASGLFVQPLGRADITRGRAHPTGTLRFRSPPRDASDVSSATDH